MRAWALALATSALLAGGVTTAQAAAPVKAQDINTTIDAHSNVREEPRLKAKIAYTTKVLTPTVIFCYVYGDFYTDGRTSTAVWYNSGLGWIWGGNVNTTQDPPPGLPVC